MLTDCEIILRVRRITPLFLAAWCWALLSFCWPAGAQVIGQPLPPWTPGVLDIHQIQTGRGNAAYFIFPDGTTMLLDAGAVPGAQGLEQGPARPDATRSPAAWIVHYITQVSPRQPPTLDYALITHYHDDHMGAILQVARNIPISTLIDRGDQPAPPSTSLVASYLEFRKGRKSEVFRAGRADQIRQLHNSDNTFEVRNIAANGDVWTGRGTETRSEFPIGWTNLPPADQPGENQFSAAIRIRYGPFNYFSGGDVPGVVLDRKPSWHELETPIARAVGPVDVLVLNHHGWLDTTNEFFLETLRPRAVIIPAWHATHPDHGVLRRLLSANSRPDLFVTSLLDAPRAVFSYLGPVFKSSEGHVVTRVSAGGATYRIIILDDTSPAQLVTAIHGPYASR
jgi:beta-lactamase superfamily II metal-dependent hydrolase